MCLKFPVDIDFWEVIHILFGLWQIGICVALPWNNLVCFESNS